MKVLFALALVCAVALVQANQVIDDFTVDQNPLSVSGSKLADSETVTAATTSIFGGERDTTLDLAPAAATSCRTGLSSTAYVNPSGFLDANNDGINDNPSDLGLFVAANDQSCYAKAVLTYAGAGGAGLTGSDRNFNNIGAAFHIRYYSDLVNRQVVLQVVSGANTCTATLTTTGSQILDDKTVPFGAFSTGCNFGAIDKLQVVIPAQSNLDVTLFLFEFVSASLSGRVHNDCTCDGTFNGSDTLVAGQTVTATPGANCGGAATITTTTAGDGTYRFTSLAACSYTISIAATTCGSTPNTQTKTTTVGTEVTNVNFAIPVPSTLSAPADISIECNQATPTTKATLSSPCGTSDVTTFTDSVTQQAVCPSNGNPGTNKVITRTFTANGQTATQRITVNLDTQAPTYTNPADVTITCQQFSSDPNVTPIPTSLTGAPAMQDNCSTPSFTFVDSISQSCDTTVCGSSYTIIRTFSVKDSCGNNANPIGSSQRITRGACSSTGSFICPIQSVCGVNPPPPPNVPPPPPQTGDCNGNTNSRTTNTLSQAVTIPTNSLTTVELTNSRSTLTSDDFTNASALTNSRTTLTTAENVAGNTNTKTTITSEDFSGASLATNSRTSLTNSENLAGSPTPNTSNDSPFPLNSSGSSNASPASNSGSSNASPNSSNNNSNSNNNNNSSNNNSSNNSSATSLAASLVALVALFFLF